MIKNDIRYIIKRILIGLGICVGLFYLKSCNVYALDSNTYNTYFYNEKNFPLNQSSSCHSVGQTYKYVIKGHEYNIEYKAEGIYINNSLVASDSNYLCNAWILLKWANDGDDVSFMYFRPVTGNSVINIIYTPSILNYSNNFPYSSDSLYAGSNVVHVYRYRYNFQNGNYTSKTENELTQCTSGCYDHDNRTDLYYNNVIYGYSFYVYGVNSTTHLGLFYNNNRKWITSDYSSPNYTYKNPYIESLTPTPILTEDDSVLLGFNFKLVFSHFSTSSYIYKYRVGNGPTLILSQNNFQLSIRENKTLYVWVENLQGDVLDSETFTVSNIGSLYNGSYSIDITYNNVAPYDTQNTGGSKIIDRVDLFLKYLPKTNYLKYQYQYVSNGSTLDPQAWVTLNDNNTSVNEYTLPVHNNGTLYARILDSSDNVVDSMTFNVDSIGKLKLYGNSNNISNIFTRLKDNINYSGPISSLILIPIEFLTTIYNSANGLCTSYNLGSLFGTNIVFPCVDLEDYLGSTLWSLIDILSSIGIIFGISRFIKKQYNKFTNLDSSDNDIM